jgi:hypothetical protein
VERARRGAGGPADKKSRSVIDLEHGMRRCQRLPVMFRTPLMPSDLISLDIKTRAVRACRKRQWIRLFLNMDLSTVHVRQVTVQRPEDRTTLP